MADKFYLEALKRRKELDSKNLKPYLNIYLNKLDKLDKKEKKGLLKTRFYIALFFKTLQQ